MHKSTTRPMTVNGTRLTRRSLRQHSVRWESTRHSRLELSPQEPKRNCEPISRKAAVDFPYAALHYGYVCLFGAHVHLLLSDREHAMRPALSITATRKRFVDAYTPEKLRATFVQDTSYFGLLHTDGNILFVCPQMTPSPPNAQGRY